MPDEIASYREDEDDNPWRDKGWWPRHVHERRAEIIAFFMGDTEGYIKDLQMALGGAARIGDQKLFDEALRRGANPSDKFTSQATTPLHNCASSPCLIDTTCLSKLLELGADPNLLNEGWTPLHGAAMSGQPEAVQVLIDAGADIEAKIVGRGERPLHKAAQGGNLTTARCLVEAGAHIDARIDDEPKGATALNEAQEDERNSEIVEYLISQGAGKIGRHLSKSKPIKLGEKKYFESLGLWSKTDESRVGPAPDYFVEWLGKNEVDPELITLFTKAMPLKKLSRGGDSFGDPDSIIETNSVYQMYLSSGLLIVGSAMGCGDHLVLDMRCGGGVGIMSHEKRYLEPRVDFSPTLAPNVGELMKSLSKAYWPRFRWLGLRRS